MGAFGGHHVVRIFAQDFVPHAACFGELAGGGNFEGINMGLFARHDAAAACPGGA